MEEVREATEVDLEAITHLAERATAELSTARGGTLYLLRESRRGSASQTVPEVLADRDQHMVVGCVDGAVVGYGIVRLDHLADGEVLGVVDDIFVEPGTRGGGFGRAIMADLMQWSTNRGATGIDSVVLPGMRISKSFFEACGMVARAIIVHRPLGTPVGSPAQPDDDEQGCG